MKTTYLYSPEKESEERTKVAKSFLASNMSAYAVIESKTGFEVTLLLFDKDLHPSNIVARTKGGKVILMGIAGCNDGVVWSGSTDGWGPGNRPALHNKVEEILRNLVSQ